MATYERQLANNDAGYAQMNLDPIFQKQDDGSGSSSGKPGQDANVVNSEPPFRVAVVGYKAKKFLKGLMKAWSGKQNKVRPSKENKFEREIHFRAVEEAAYNFDFSILNDEDGVICVIHHGAHTQVRKADEILRGRERLLPEKPTVLISTNASSFEPRDPDQAPERSAFCDMCDIFTHVQFPKRASLFILEKALARILDVTLPDDVQLREH